MDSRFRVELIAATPNPQQVVYAAMHQDYSEEFVANERHKWPSETKAGEIAVKRLLEGNRGHFGCTEGPTITFNVGYFPHSVMQQARTHRIATFDVQCLSGDTQIWCGGDKWWGINKKVPLKQLYDEQNNYKTLEILSYDKNQDDPFVKNAVDAIVFNGEALLYQVVTNSGATILATENHKFLNYTTKAASQFYSLKQLRTGVPIVLCNSNHRIQIDTITEIKEYGVKPVYDICMASEPHNFVANGFVVHNSMRYTGARISDAVDGKRDIEDVFYLRPVGYYTDRQGKKYHYSQSQRQADLEWCLEAARRYKLDMEAGMSEEHARGKIPFDFRQHFVVSFNLRSLMHFLDLRFKKDAQLEIQQLCELMWVHFQEWTPEIAQWYAANRLHKARLSP